MTEEELMNRHGVSLYGADKIALLIPPMLPMSKIEALVLAAWLVALADSLDENFSAILKEIQSL